MGMLIGFTTIGTPAMAIEEPKFTVSLHEGAIEVRDYQAAVAAEVTVTGDQKGAASKGFRLLAGYIFGGNTRHQSIPITAPVAQERAGEKNRDDPASHPNSIGWRLGGSVDHARRLFA